MRLGPAVLRAYRQGRGDRHAMHNRAGRGAVHAFGLRPLDKVEVLLGLQIRGGGLCFLLLWMALAVRHERQRGR